MKFLLLAPILGYILSSCKPASSAEPGLEKECQDSVYSVSADLSIINIQITDAAFEKYLVEKGLDSDKLINGFITKSDAMEVDSIFLLNPSITGVPEYEIIKSVKGIEYFKNLSVFVSVHELIENIDFSHNENLKYVHIEDYHGSVGGGPGRDKYRALKRINFGKNPNLKEISLLSTLLEEVDLSGLPNLSKVVIGGYELETIYLNNKNQIKPGWDIIPTNEKTIEYKICENP